MQVLAIGNSFSTDATRYLHRLARVAGQDLTVVNLHIGGCSLSRHYRNMLSGERIYELQINGERSGFSVSLQEALLNRDWDVITLQQSSPNSTKYETYQPYLNELAAYVRHCVPQAKVYIHETWPYEQGSERLNVLMGYQKYQDMYRDLHAAYAQAAKDISADGVIPSGTLLLSLMAQGIKVHRDTFHASYGLGRYALSLLWLRVLTHASVSDLTLPSLDEPADEAQLKAVRENIMYILP